jgi:hypothetical protein
MITTPLTEAYEFALWFVDDPHDDCSHWVGLI